MSRLRIFFTGWRATLARCITATALVAIINIVCFSLAIPRLEPVAQDATQADQATSDGALFTGNCNHAERLNFWLHLLINVLSTVLLSTSNFAQQVFTAPTREEVDLAHIRRRWLDIGVLSYRNLRGISSWRVAAWAIMALTSMPIHLIYNSVVSLETRINQYDVWMVAEGNLTASQHSVAGTQSIEDFVRLDNARCIDEYGRDFITEWSDVVLVIEPESSSNMAPNAHLSTSDPVDYGSPPYGWMCSGGPLKRDHLPCDASDLKSYPNDWTVLDLETRHFPLRDRKAVRVSYCLAKPVPEQCKLTMSIPLFTVVIACNVAKLLGLIAAWFLTKQQPLLTLGDAVSSFLDRHDAFTIDQPLLSKTPGCPLVWTHSERTWVSKSHRWAWLVSRRRYVITMGLSVSPRATAVSEDTNADVALTSCLIALVVTSIFLGLGIAHITTERPPTLPELWNRGFGTVNVDCLVSLHSDGTYRNASIGVALLSNLPQLLISLLYTSLNAMWTTMHVGIEWNSFGIKRKGLRTTNPVGKQRDTYWLSLPWKFGLPLSISSAALHWLVSQSIFFVRLVVSDGDRVQNIVTTPGYSPISIIFSMLCGALIVATTIALSLRKFKEAIPQVGTCSAVLSSACHPPEYDQDAAVEAVQWGPVSQSQDKEKHYCMTSRPILSTQD